MKSVLIIAFFILSTQVQAQFGKEVLDRAKQAAKEKVNQKVEERTSDVIDHADKKLEDIITGKEKSNKKRKGHSSESARERNSRGDRSSEVVEVTELVFQTSITGKPAKEKMENILREVDGVSNVAVDEDSGIVYITPQPGVDIRNPITALIKKNGFSVKEKK